MSTKKKKKSTKHTVPPSAFRESTVNELSGLDDDSRCKLAVTHYAKIKKEERSHEDYDAIVNLLTIVTHKQEWKDYQLWLQEKKIFMFKEANANLIRLNRELVKHIKDDNNGDESNLLRVIRGYRHAYMSKVTDVTLNGDSYTLTRGTI